MKNSSHYVDTPEEAISEPQIENLCYNFGLDLDDYHRPFMDHMREAFGIYENDKDAHYGLDLQGNSIYKQIEAMGKPALIKNVGFPLVNLVHGIQMDSRYEVKALPVGDEDMAVAEGTNMGLEFISKRNQVARRGSRQFLDKLICGRGWLVCDQVYDDKDIFGTRTKITNADPGEITYDRKSHEHDLSDADYCRRQQFVNRGMAKLMWPDKEYELSLYYNWFNENNIDTKRTDQNLISSLRMNIMLNEFYYRVHVQKKFLIHEASGVIVNASDKTNEQIREYMYHVPDLKVVRRPGSEMRFAHTVGNPAAGVLLDYGKSPYADDYFPYIPDFAYRSRDIDFGIFKPIMDQIREGNKRTSQILHYINEMPKTRIITNDEELTNQFEQGEEIITVRDGFKFTVVDPSKFPVALANLIIANGDDAKMITNITDDLKGVRKGQDSGAVVDTRKQSAMTAINSLFDNHMGSVELRGRIIMSRNRQFMSPAKFARLMGPKKADPEVINIIKARDTEDYDLSIALTPHTPGLRWENFQQIREMRKEFPEIVTPEVYIEASDVPQKDDMLANVKEMRDAGVDPGAPVEGATVR